MSIKASATTTAKSGRKRGPPKAKLTEEVLIGDGGVSKIFNELKGIKWSEEKTPEAQGTNLKLLLHKYETWGKQMVPQLKFEEFVASLEKLAGRPGMKRRIINLEVGLPFDWQEQIDSGATMATGEAGATESEVTKSKVVIDHSDDEDGGQDPLSDTDDDFLESVIPQAQPTVRTAGPPPTTTTSSSSSPSTSATTSAATSSASSTLTEEQKKRIEENRKRALEIRQQKEATSAIKASVVTPQAPPPQP